MLFIRVEAYLQSRGMQITGVTRLLLAEDCSFLPQFCLLIKDRAPLHHLQELEEISNYLQNLNDVGFKVSQKKF